MSGGGSTSTQTNSISPWMEEAAKTQLGKATALTDTTQNPYQQYGGQRIAEFNPMQQKYFQGMDSLQPSAAINQGIGVAGQAAQQALGTSYDPAQFQNQFQAPGQFDPGQFRAERASTQSFRQPGAAEAYMDPYMQNVVGIQQREAQRAADIAGTQRGAQAVGAGAFGGSRQAIMDAEAARNLSQQKGDIQARGLQSAFQNAQQQFNAEQAAGLQAQLANQQTGLTAQQLGEQSRQFGAGQGMTAAQAAAQYGQAAEQLGEQSRQYGAGLGLQGLQTALSGASQLGGLGSTQFGQQKDVLAGLQSAGGQQQALEQAKLSQGYEDFLAQQKYPYQQLEFMSNIMRGTPYSSTTSMYSPGASTGSQLLGAGTSLAGAALMGGWKPFKEGGAVSDAKAKKKKSAGLAELALSKI